MVTFGEKANIQKAVTARIHRDSFAFPLKVEHIFGSSITPNWEYERTGSFMNELSATSILI